MLILLYSNAKGCVDTRPVVGSRQAAHLVHVWLQPVQRRLGGETGTNFEAIKVMFGRNLQGHAFFDGLDWEHLYDKDGPWLPPAPGAVEPLLQPLRPSQVPRVASA